MTTQNSDLIYIERLFRVIDNSLFMTTGNLSYDRLTQAIIDLANAVLAYNGETEDWLYIGEYRTAPLCDLIPGAYWHYMEWHGGQSSKGYEALSVLGKIYSPGMENSDYLDPTYQALDSMAEAYYFLLDRLDNHYNQID